MTQEEKAKRYDEALERAIAFNNGEDSNIEEGTTLCEYIFPELKESEDERIRKKLIEAVKGDMVIGGGTFSEVVDGINRNHAFEEGAKWADETHGKELMYAIQKTGERTKREVIDKACEWLNNNAENYTINGGLSIECLIYSFKKAMLNG